MKKETIKLMFDYLSGPIRCNYIDEDTFKKMTGIKVVDEDLILKDLNNKASELYSSYYEFNSHNLPCYFNYKQQFKDRFIMRDLLQKIFERLNEINDGSYVIEPLALDEYNKLCLKATFEDLNGK